MRGKTFATLIVVGMLAYGGQKAYVAFTNRKPLKTTCADYVSSNSSAKWVLLSGCSLDYDRAIQLTGQVFKTDKGVFVPVRPIRSKAPAPILLHFEKEGFVRRYQDFLKAPLFATLENGEAIDGLVQFGMDTDSKVEDAIDKSSLKGQLAANYKLIEASAKPDMGEGIFGIGLIITGIVAGLLVLRARRIAQRTKPSPLPMSPPPLPPVPH